MQLFPLLMVFYMVSNHAARKMPKLPESLSDYKSNFEKGNMCLTEECNDIVTNLMWKMDMTVDPCDDFYQFVCGQYRKMMIPHDMKSVGSLSITQRKLFMQLTMLLEQPIKPDEIQPIKMTKILYSLCMDNESIDARGVDPAKEIMAGMVDWPLIHGDDWSESSWEWTETIYRLQEAGLDTSYFINLDISNEYINSRRRTIVIRLPTLDLPRELLTQGFSNKVVQAYYKYSVDMAVMFGAERTRAIKEMKEVLELGISLAFASTISIYTPNISDSYERMTIKSMESKFPSIPWLEYTRRLSNHMNITKDEPIEVLVTSYIKEFETICNRTPKRVLANYLGWRFASSVVILLSSNVRDRFFQYNMIREGIKQKPQRWFDCIDIVTYMLRPALSSLYVRYFFDQKSKAVASDMADRIKSEMVEYLTNNKWMDDKTRINALAKVHAMAKHIGFPDELLDDNKLINYYKNLEITNDGKFFEAIINVTKFKKEFKLSRLREPINKTEWISNAIATQVNAFYGHSQNAIIIPAGILQGDFFSSERPNYMNYGAIGQAIGHEVAHSFDILGTQYDSEGNVKNWWQGETKKKYYEKTQCIAEQAESYVESQMNMKFNGHRTLSENVADNGGIRLAYNAYLKWENENSIEGSLQHLRFSPHQMFWISYASTKCLAIRNETLHEYIATDKHSPNEFRVNGPLSNIDEFSYDFNCPQGSKMNPVKKCVV